MYVGWDNREYEDPEMDAMLQDAQEGKRTMTKLAIIDLDGVIADATARFARAEEAKQEYLNDPDSFSDLRTATDLYWRTVFTPEHVALDTLIEGVTENLWQIEYQGYVLVYLTSRPESMRKATQDWLDLHKIETLHPAFGSMLVMKPSAFQYTKTVVWKAGTVQMLAEMFQANEVLFVDDEAMNIADLQKYEHPFQLRCATSLDIAVNGDTEQEDGFKPF